MPPLLTDSIVQGTCEKDVWLLADLLDLSPACITIHDTKGNFIYANKKTFETHGYSKDEFLKIKLNKLDTPEYSRLIKPRMKKLMQEGETSFESEHFCKNGSTLPLLVFVKITKWHDQKIILSVALDNRERKKTEQKLRYQANLLENVSDAIIATDMQYKIRFWNKVAENQYGWKEKEVIGHAFKEFIINDYLGNSLDIILLKISQENFWKGEVTQNRRDGTRLHIMTTLSTIRDSHNKTIGYIAVNRDITEHRKAEEERLNIERQLQKIQKLESLGTLAAGIAHDFNNLLSGIYGYMDMARVVSKDSEVTEYLNASFNTMNRARGLTQQLLTFEKGGVPTLKTGNLTKFIYDTIKFVSIGSSISCTVNIPDDLWPCDYDATQIGQVIDNLVINAQQAMPLGG